MLTALVIIFAVGYACIALEHPLKVHKSASALVGASLLWTVYALLGGDHHLISENLKESSSATAQIVFFLIGAMTIVEVVGPAIIEDDSDIKTTPFEQNLMFVMGIGCLVAVPIFKTVTHLPPFMGILFGLGILWLVGNILHRNKEDELQAAGRVNQASGPASRQSQAGRRWRQKAGINGSDWKSEKTAKIGRCPCLPA